MYKPQRTSKYPAMHTLENENKAIAKAGTFFDEEGIPFFSRRSGVCPVVQVAVIGDADRDTVFHALDSVFARPEVKELADACSRFSFRVNVLESDIIRRPSSAAGHATTWSHYQPRTYFYMYESDAFIAEQSAPKKNPPDDETCMCLETATTPIWFVLCFGENPSLHASMARFSKRSGGRFGDHVIHI